MVKFKSKNKRLQSNTKGWFLFVVNMSKLLLKLNKRKSAQKSPAITNSELLTFKFNNSQKVNNVNLNAPISKSSRLLG